MEVYARISVHYDDISSDAELIANDLVHIGKAMVPYTQCFVFNMSLEQILGKLWLRSVVERKKANLLGVYYLMALIYFGVLANSYSLKN